MRTGRCAASQRAGERERRAACRSLSPLAAAAVSLGWRDAAARTQQQSSERSTAKRRGSTAATATSWRKARRCGRGEERGGEEEDRRAEQQERQHRNDRQSTTQQREREQCAKRADADPSGDSVLSRADRDHGRLAGAQEHADQSLRF